MNVNKKTLMNVIKLRCYYILVETKNSQAVRLVRSGYSRIPEEPMGNMRYFNSKLHKCLKSVHQWMITMFLVLGQVAE